MSKRQVASRRRLFQGKTLTSPKTTIWPYSNRKSYMNLWDPFPARVTVRLRYNTSPTITVGTGVATNYVFAANSIFDPDVTGTGHQPYGHDTYATIYNQYQVKKATIVVTAAGNTSCMFGVNISDQAAAYTDFDTIKERKGSKYAVMVSNGPTQTVVNYFTSKFMGNQFQQAATFGANPADLFYFNVWATMPNITDAGADRDFNVAIVYDVEMWDLKPLAQS